jgi:sulfatase maturation enzyme AslB (radical SAM superfamily)
MDSFSNGFFENNNVTCMSPWYELKINSNGEYTYCHASKDHEKSTMLPSDWFNNGSAVNQARNQIKHGHSVSGCRECYQTEQAKLLSYRNRRNLQAAIYPNNFFKQSLHSSPAWNRMNGKTQHIMPSFIHVSLNNVCNMACRMCTPDNSSKLSATFKKAGIISAIPAISDWTQDSKKWQDFCSLVIDNSSLMCLHFMGGEPMLAKKFYELIDLCIKKNAVNFHLTFVTNGTIVDTEIIKKLRHFKSVCIEVSIENFHPSNDYIRLGGNYKQLKRNIELLLTHRSDTISVVLRTVPQALSIIHYDTIIDFAVKHDVAIDSNIISRPEYLKIFVLPTKVKQQLKIQLSEKYRELIDSTSTNTAVSSLVSLRNNSQVLTQLSTHVRLLLTLLTETETENMHLLRQQFVDYNCKIDTVSGLKFTSVFPVLGEFYNEYCSN